MTSDLEVHYHCARLAEFAAELEGCWFEPRLHSTAALKLGLLVTTLPNARNLTRAKDRNLGPGGAHDALLLSLLLSRLHQRQSKTMN